MKKKYYIFKINLKILNVISILLFILLFGITIIFFPNIIKSFLLKSGDFSYYITLIIIMILYFALHEVFHAMGYLLYGAKWKNITFGMELEKGVFYCLCKQDITRKNILNSLLFPFFYIGVVTYIIGVIFNLPLLVVLSILNISGAAADIMYFIFIIRLSKNVEYSEMDDGTSFAIKSDEDVSKIRHFGLDFVGVQNKIEREDYKKIKISKLSFLVIVVFSLLYILSIFL